MLKIKLSRIGRKNLPFYRLVVAEEHSKSVGKNIAILGSYDPNDVQNRLTIDSSAYADWLKKGAQPTKTVRLLIEKQAKAKTK